MLTKYVECHDFPANGVRIQRGFEPKGLGHDPSLKVTFKFPFEGLPTVTVTPVWENTGNEVPHVETLGEVAEDHFICWSNNAADQFGIMWIAIGKIPGP